MGCLNTSPPQGNLPLNLYLEPSLSCFWSPAQMLSVGPLAQADRPLGWGCFQLPQDLLPLTTRSLLALGYVLTYWGEVPSPPLTLRGSTAPLSRSPGCIPSRLQGLLSSPLEAGPLCPWSEGVGSLAPMRRRRLSPLTSLSTGILSTSPRNLQLFLLYPESRGALGGRTCFGTLSTSCTSL